MIRYSSRLNRIRRTRSFSSIFVLNKLARYALFGVIGAIVLFIFYFLWVSRDLPTPGKLANGNLKDSTKILDKNGVVLYSIYKDYNRLYVPLDNIPETLKEATIATEDKDFYTNQGISVTGLARGLILDPILKKRATGGSTITQQLVKNSLLSPERTASRKLKEIILAIEVDQRFSKDQILEMYLNNAPYGGTAIGAEAASNLYFGKHAKELDLAQSAFLAGLPQLPSVYSPYANPGSKAYLDRTQLVLNRMREEGYISKKQVDDAMREVKAFKFTARQGNLKAPHFVQYVKDQLVKLYGDAVVENGNLTVQTTLDYKIQKEAEDIVQEEVAKLKSSDVGNGAAVVMDPKTGAILAMVGSQNYFDNENEGNFNASTARRQPGSSLKPVMYAAAFQKGYTPATTIMDVSTDFPTNVPGQADYKPVNYDGKFRGPVQIRFALGNSLNIPAVKMLARVGIKPVMQLAYNMGIDNWKPTDENLRSVGLSLVLGGREATLLQEVTAYSVFADGGIRHDPYAIEWVKDAKGKEIYKHKESSGTRVLSPEIAFLISHILLDNNARADAFGTNSLLNIPGHTVAVKTGTTDSKRDNWAIGYTPSYVAGVWVGNNDNKPMNPRIASGITGATPIWRNIMIATLKGKKNEQFPVPSGVTAVQVDSLFGGQSHNGQPTRTEYFVKGTEPTTISPIYKQVKISSHQDGKLANSEEISRGDYKTKEYIVFSESDPVSTDGKNRWQDAINAWIDSNRKDDPLYHPPGETSDYKYDGNNNNNSNPTDSPTPTVSAAVTPTPTP